MSGGPYFEDLRVGQVFGKAPSLTLTAGMAAVHQAIIGDRLRLALDADLSGAVIGAPAALAHPALVCDVAIGQSTLATQRVKANLFYRGLNFHRFPVIGDTLYTRTEVVGLRATTAEARAGADRPGGAEDNHHRPGRPTGARLLPVRHAAGEIRHRHQRHDDLSAIGSDAVAPVSDPTADWNAAAFRSWVAGDHFDGGLAGAVLHSTADVVTSAPGTRSTHLERRCRAS